MTLLRHELRQGRVSLAVWTLSVSFLLCVCVFLYPDMRGEMDGMGELFASMGSFTAAFGMDRLNFGTFLGFYAVECGNVLGLGGAFFAALCAVAALAREEGGGTAEFLFTHPISRARVVGMKLLAVLAQLAIFSAVVLVCALGSTLAIGEKVSGEMLLLHLASFLTAAETALLCFGLSAFLRRGGLGLGLGVAAMGYFLNLIANLMEEGRWLKFLTPFGYADGAELVSAGQLDAPLVLVGLGLGLACAAVGALHYCRKDLH